MRQTVCDKCGDVIPPHKGWRGWLSTTKKLGKKDRQDYYHFDICKKCGDEILVGFEPKLKVSNTSYRAGDC